MKCKRAGKRKPCMSPMVAAEDGFEEAVSSNAQANNILGYYENDYFTSPKETEVPLVSKKMKSVLNKSPWDFSSSNSKPNKKTKSWQVDNTNKKNSELTARQDPLYNKRELYSALAVIRNVMKLDAARSFNVPVDPVALKIPDYFNIIDTPMDFGTICTNLEKGVKYKNAKDVLNDVQYIWQNCLKYNKKRHYILELMKRVKENFTKYWTEAGLFVKEPQERNDSVERRHPYGYSYTTDPLFDRPTHMYRNQLSVDPPYCPPSQHSSSCKLPLQPQRKSFQHQQSFQGPLFSQADDGIDLSSSEENFHSMPIAESMIRCTKRGPKCPVGPMNATDERQGQVALSQMVCPQPSSNSGGPSQHPDGTFQVQLSSNQPQPSCSLAGTADNRVGARLTREKAQGRLRGRNRCLEVLNITEKIPVDVNEFGQAVGLEAPKLTSFLGMIARDGNISPLNYLDWRALPDENKKRMWEDVLSKFDIDPNSKYWVLKSIGKKWKDWKAELKATHYYIHKTDEERIADRDERVLPDQWRVLVSFWNSQKAKERSARNKAIRAHQQTSHAAGKKSFARIREERRKRPHGKAPSRTEMCILTRTKKNGHPVNEATSAVISKLRETAQQQEAPEGCDIQDDVFTQVMGRDRHGYVRTFGLGPSLSDFGGPSRAEAEAMKMAATVNAEVKEMKEKMMSLEKTCAKMATQIAAVMSIMSDMQKKLSDKDVVPPSQVADVSVDSGTLPSASIHGVSPNQNQASRSKTQGTRRFCRKRVDAWLKGSSSSSWHL